MTKDEALKMAIDFIEEITNAAGKYTYVNKTSLVADSYSIASKLKEALEQPAQDDDLMTGTWIRYNDGDDNKRLALELDIAMNGIDGAAKSPALIDVLSQAVDYFKKPFTRDWKETIDERIARDSEFKEALEQQCQEPIGYVSTIPIVTPQAIRSDKNDIFRIPVYTHQAKRLSEDNI